MLSHPRLFWRLVAPSVLVSLLLLGMGGACAFYVQRLNRYASEELDRSLENLLSGEQLLLSIRDIRVTLLRYEVTRDDYFRRSARKHVVETEALISQDRSLRLTSEMAQSLREMRTAFTEFSISARKDLDFDQENWNFEPASIAALRQNLTSEVLPPAARLLRLFQEEAASNSDRNQALARRVGILLVGLGITGSAAGLLAGFAISRGVTRSIAELGGSLRSLRSTLDQEENESFHLEQNDSGLPGLQEAVEDLSQRTETVVRQLHQTRQQAQTSEQLATVGKLAAGIAHEIRNPLTSIKLLVQSANERDSTLGGQQLEILEEEISRLEKLLQSFLDFARPPRPSMKSFSLAHVIEQTVNVVRARAERQGIAIHWDPIKPIVDVMGDGQQLQRVVLNLLLNAMDAQPQGGDIWVELRSIDSSEEIEFFVADRGIGLPADIGERIFEPFVSTKEAGVGLGLSLSQQIVNAHGGIISAKSRDGGGAVFAVRLPVETKRCDASMTEEEAAKLQG